ncbi:MAG TPA: DUF3822 family protein [Candidatus Coprenecus stercoravium]|uniref:DUF3822 family protein n=1 Tax=Candidatus Coprenecus stercoravium TaxID=2840735 RepID=A0A9D2GQY5_9BACT|nr:DUF3822 family protein [Candidatus Coprenecus stercoravium]
MGGYSFVIYDRSGKRLASDSRPCPVDLSAEDLGKVLSAPFASVTVFYTTWKYTLVPVSQFSKDSAREYLETVRDLQPDDTVHTVEVPSHKAVMVFAVPGGIYSGISALNRNVRFYPLASCLIDRLAGITDNNRLLVSFSAGMLHVVAAERDRLLFANSFPAADLATAEYFIFSVTKEVLFNPENTCLYVFGEIKPEVRGELERYFVSVRTLL